MQPIDTDLAAEMSALTGLTYVTRCSIKLNGRVTHVAEVPSQQSVDCSSYWSVLTSMDSLISLAA